MATQDGDKPTKPPTHDATQTASTLAARRGTGSRRTSDRSGGPSPMPGLEVGNAFGPWTLSRLLGRGGFAEVWEATETATGRRVALKVLTEMRAASAEAATRFEQEGRLAASISSPRCVFILGAQSVDGVPVIAMELMPGGSLQDLLKERGRLPVEDAVEHVLDIIEGLEAAQAAGIVHRDVKPSNCFLDRDGRVRIGDFGISKSLEATSKLTVTGSFLGTPAYASPEQLRGKPVDFRSDMYSVGATLYALLTGRAPFESTNAGDLLAKIVGEKVPPLASHGARVPRALEKAVLRALAKDPADRFRSHEEMRRALAPFRRTVAEPAGLGRRFAGWLVDRALTTVCLVPVVASTGLDEDGLSAKALDAMVTIAYFSWCESRWSLTLGKKLLGLRVVTPDRLPLTWRQAAIRASVLVGLLSLAPRLVASVPLGALGWVAQLAALATMVAGLAALLWPLRTKPGLMLQDVLSGTSVVSSVPRAMRAVRSLRARVEDLAPEAAPVVTSGRMRGPFTLLEPFTPGDGWVVHAGIDFTLERRAWIVEMESGGPPPVADVDRPTRLRWLLSGESDGRRWVAVEAPGGASLPAIVARSGRLHWGDVRLLLADLMSELSAAREAGDLPERISVRQLWIDGHGHLRLVPLPVEPDPEGHDEPVPAERWAELVHRMVLLTLDGRWPSPGDIEGRRPEAILPVHAAPFIDAICGSPRRLVAEELRVLEAWLDRVRELPHELTRRARTLAMAWWGLGPLIVFAIAVIPVRIAVARDWIATAAISGLTASTWCALAAVPAIALSFALRGGWGMRREGVAVQRLDGRPASRLRCMARTAVALYLPIACSGLVVAAWKDPEPSDPLAHAVAGLVVPGVMLLGAAFGIWRVDRGVPELLTRTRLVAQ